MEVLDAPINETDRSNVKYGGFWQRFGAMIIDGFILAPVTFGLTYFNIISWKSPLALVVITLIGVSYKPFMELNYGATWGKMAVKLRVVNLEFEKATLGEILLRNIFHIGPQLITLLLKSLQRFNSSIFPAGSLSLLMLLSSLQTSKKDRCMIRLPERW